jgi:hypothetical protein
MEELVITDVLGAGSLDRGQGAFVEVHTSQGDRQLRLTFEDAERLIIKLQAARRAVQAERGKSGLPPIAEKPHIPAKWETAIDPVNQVAVLRARFADESMQEAEIPRAQIAALAEFLEQALKRLESGGELRQ